MNFRNFCHIVAAFLQTFLKPSSASGLDSVFLNTLHSSQIKIIHNVTFMTVKGFLATLTQPDVKE